MPENQETSAKVAQNKLEAARNELEAAQNKLEAVRNKLKVEINKLKVEINELEVKKSSLTDEKNDLKALINQQIEQKKNLTDGVKNIQSELKQEEEKLNNTLNKKKKKLERKETKLKHKGTLELKSEENVKFVQAKLICCKIELTVAKEAESELKTEQQSLLKETWNEVLVALKKIDACHKLKEESSREEIDAMYSIAIETEPQELINCEKQRDAMHSMLINTKQGLFKLVSPMERFRLEALVKLRSLIYEMKFCIMHKNSIVLSECYEGNFINSPEYNEISSKNIFTSVTFDKNNSFTKCPFDINNASFVILAIPKIINNMLNSVQEKLYVLETLLEYLNTSLKIFDAKHDIDDINIIIKKFNINDVKIVEEIKALSYEKVKIIKKICDSQHFNRWIEIIGIENILLGEVNLERFVNEEKSQLSSTPHNDSEGFFFINKMMSMISKKHF